ncbi:LuxR C-terminal-related transcriptional regulator [Rhizobium pusense]|uniref:HTH luxR-type domain-containing protein n=2 Tax=Agrobacterium TaxID=357 RepID=A0A6H0ZIK6_9HYPH|nr:MULTISPECIES: helix-turn-helix transcriptional regulator [Rhizobium/Agrobacterium group]QCM13598.1 hypothetical protein CFBP6625_24415 [Agrobacterium tumefaciens]MCD4663580.1 LuxR C-terminal-related transcriptional regulator [Agrobacterium sp.]MDH0872691.1 LuxR C-terminal-related transcriptional regulator [Agrobacterium pusense]MDH0912485.1 LuxR C-terminal-related transcriptional regulator [Agrobacterium pusense]MDH1099050.1 LuxR C-terminal-related transcriptional regulator [Agrobacterium p
MIEKSLPYEPGVRAPRFPIQVAEFDGRAAPRSVHAFLPKLVDACGLPSFEGLVAQVAKQALDCDHVTGFSFQIDEPPVVVCMSSVDEHNPVRRVSGPYVATHWCNDPTNLFLFEKFKRDNVYLIFMSEDQVPDERYRHDCFTSTGVKHRVSLLKWHERGIIKLSFHRTERAGPFSADAMNEIVPWAEVLASLLIKHDLVRPSPRSGVEAAERYKLSIGIYCPELTAREREVCGLIAVGLSSEAIALTLNVSVNTVLTFRRRAYTKLSISSQNELMRILL